MHVLFNQSIIEKLKSIPTPYYYYDTGIFELTIQKAIQGAKKLNANIHYALKANHQPHLLKIISKYQIGADCVSGGEIIKALDNGILCKNIVYAGVGKTDDEIELALSKNIFCLNIESIEELEIVNQIAKKLNKTADIALRLNPNIDAYTHKFITTGLSENKFGINASDIHIALDKIKHLNHLNFIGLHFHIGSQITDFSVFKNLCMKVNEITRYVQGHRIIVRHLNMGGGLGIDYTQPDRNIFPDFESYFNIFEKFLERKNSCSLHFELGRALVGQCGTLITKVLISKKTGNKKFLIVDSGMNHLIRPALYEAYHKIENLSQYNLPSNEVYDVCGPICETTDYFGKNILLPHSQRGDILAIRSAGAYGEVMASDYNLRGLPPCYFSDKI